MENRVKDWLWQLVFQLIGRMNASTSPRFLSNSLKKKLEIRDKDSMWALRVLFTCNMKAQNLPRFSRIRSLIKWKIGVKMAYGNLACQPLADEFAELIPFLLNSLKKEMENQVEDWI